MDFSLDKIIYYLQINLKISKQHHICQANFNIEECLILKTDFLILSNQVWNTFITFWELQIVLVIEIVYEW